MTSCKFYGRRNSSKRRLLSNWKTKFLVLRSKLHFKRNAKYEASSASIFIFKLEEKDALSFQNKLISCYYPIYESIWSNA